jgi:uncharacterized protein (DUF488 family)
VSAPKKPIVAAQASPETIWTIGHSTRTLDEFLALLDGCRIEAVADVRRFPGSRHCPWFAREALDATLTAQGVRYEWIPALGGRRKARPDSVNTGWRNASFRGYADYLDSTEFAQGLQALLELAHRRTALMCAEAVWWRCHRAIIADVLSLRGIEVVHIVDARHRVVHPFTSPARIVRGRLTYPAPSADADAITRA